MKNSKIIFDVELDNEQVPEKITWLATDNPQGNSSTETKAVSIALWDHLQKHSLRIDLWAKDMPVDEMKKFYIECIAGIGDNMKRATDDEAMANMIYSFCDQLVEYLKQSDNQ